MKLRTRLAVLPSMASWIGILLLWWPSLRPSLLPRSAVIQGAVGGICIAVGFGLGGFVGRTIDALRARRAGTSERSPRVPATTVRYVSLAIAAVAVVVGSVRWLRWQRDQQALVQVPPHPWTAILVMLVITVLVGALLVTIARIIRHVVAALDRFVARRVAQQYVRWVVVPVVVLVVAGGFTIGSRQFARWADTNFGAFDNTTPEGVEQPTLPTASGGPGSLVDWDDLGYQGRGFTGETPSAADLAEFDTDRSTLDPIRVYVGLDSADTVDERVALAVDELERTGAFDREVLVVVTPTGTGWVNPDAARSIEYMWGGDTAIVSVQYSYLPSWIAFLVDTRSPRILGEALLRGVYDAWAQRPADDRPLLLAYGESLGSMGAESTFAADSLAASFADLASTYQGALFVGPTRSNALFGRMIDERTGGSPSWRPAVTGAPEVRVANRVSQIGGDDTTWATPRALWLHHPSDAIGTWRIANLWSAPGWADDPAPHDVPPAATWVPFVTFVQESFDLMNGFSATPGFGHDYRTDLVDGWAAVAPPPGWTAADSARLRTFLDLDGGPDRAG